MKENLLKIYSSWRLKQAEKERFELQRKHLYHKHEIERQELEQDFVISKINELNSLKVDGRMPENLAMPE